MYKKNKQNDKHRSSRGHMDTQDQERGKRKIMKDFEIFGSSQMSGKESKKIEEKKVVSLGLKPPKHQRSPLSVAQPGMKKQKVVVGKMYKKNKEVDKHGSLGGHMDTQDKKMDIRKIMKDVENFGCSHMSWKERKKIEEKKVVSLGGKAPKQQRLPLSVARPRMKKQKEREQQLLQERLILGQFGGRLGDSSKRSMGKHRPEERGLKSGGGDFKNGVLNVKHLLNPAQSKDKAFESHGPSGGKWKKGNKKGGKKSR